ncbi:ankyrin repeat-containing domain protein [Tirmania nivea]|nr:ankyrin repeat-containing domain protein [Tirmania nivea]
MLSDLSLGDLSVSQIAVLNLPIDLADVSNPEPFQQQSSIETHRSRPYSRRKWSSRGRIHNAIEAGNEFVVRTLLNMGMDVEELDSSGRTPLVHAAVKHQEAICKLLLEKGAKVGALKTFTSGMTFTERFELLVPSAVSMHYVVNAGYKTILQLLSLIESRDTEGWTPLASAAFNNNEALCEFLVEKGCSLCLVTEQKYQLKSKLSHRIHVAAQGGHKTALQLLLDIGADINERDSSGETALLQAVFYNHLSCVKILIERRADATISTNEDISVLHHAALRSTNSEMMKFVLGHIGTRARELLNATNQWGNTPLHDCSFGSRIVGLENVKMLLQAGATLTIKNNRGKTPYECARERGSKEIAKYLWSQLSRKQQACEQAPPSDW